MPAVSKTITTSPTLLARAKGGKSRQWLRIELLRSESADVTIGIGDPAVAAGAGHLLNRGWGMFIANDPLAKPAAPAIYGIVATGSVTVTVDEGI